MPKMTLPKDSGSGLSMRLDEAQRRMLLKLLADEEAKEPKSPNGG